MDERIVGFPPVCGSDAKLLILGSMPSVASLQQSFYYAHPRNIFWPMLAEILGEEAPLHVEEKKAMLLRHRIALWDTAHSCVREGSLDSSIRQAQANDFDGLFESCPQIDCILFNGGTAQRLYLRLVSKNDGKRHRLLPSTSPAYTMEYSKKLELWKQALKEGLNESL